ncbi:hypothetical protein NDU88_002321 [Pleurodeles waltl]|uniref:Uncharacterized protein n=1 Tax=Pleurodeles waltl TaxID=8319 RepID=A0AAV7UV91_PLEWA|nr:hypothetical protein NDU88_002321 [Pleurodeles waltl]
MDAQHPLTEADSDANPMQLIFVIPDFQRDTAGCGKSTQSLPGPKVPDRIDASLSCGKEETTHATQLEGE